MDEGVIEVVATVGRKALANVDRYFTNDVGTIAQELLQNARRAGASNVRVSVDHRSSTVRVVDDGRGIDKADAGLLVTFGGSGNDEVTEGDEAPAGMGFFSLARRGATVRTRDWSMDVTPAAFTGAEPARLVDGYDPVVGTTVTFRDEGARRSNTAQAIYAAFVEVARGMPFATVVNGEEVARFSPVDRLRRTDGTPLFDDMTERRVGDCLVVVARFEDGHAPFRRAAPTERSGWQGQDRLPGVFLSAEIFGQAIDLGPHRTHAMDRDFLEAPEGEVLVPDGAGSWVSRWPRYVAVMQALGSETLVPRLPDRQELVDTPGLAAIAREVRSMVACLAARAGRQSVGRSWVAAACSEEGLRLGPRQLVLRRPRYAGNGVGNSGVPVAVHDAGRPSEGADAGVVVLANPEGNALLLLETICAGRGRRGAVSSRVLEGPVGDLEGFDPITRVDLAVDDETHVLCDSDPVGSGDPPILCDEDFMCLDDEEGSRVRRVGSIVASLRTRSGLRERRTLRHVTWVDYDGVPRAVVTARASADEVTNQMMRATTWENEGDAYELEGEVEREHDRLTRLVTVAILGPARAAAATLAELAIEGFSEDVVAVTFRRDGTGRGVVEVEMADGTRVRSEAHVAYEEIRRRPTDVTDLDLDLDF